MILMKLNFSTKSTRENCCLKNEDNFVWNLSYFHVKSSLTFANINEEMRIFNYQFTIIMVEHGYLVMDANACKRQTQTGTAVFQNYAKLRKLSLNSGKEWEILKVKNFPKKQWTALRHRVEISHIHLQQPNNNVRIKCGNKYIHI